MLEWRDGLQVAPSTSGMEFQLPGADYASIELSKDAYGFEEVLEEFSVARRIVLVTYSLDLGPGAKLLDRLRSLDAEVQVTLITFIPNRWEAYHNRASAERARRRIGQYLEALDPQRFRCAFEPWFCFENHAKIVATESVAYFGSQNFADSSHKNFECGLLVRGEEILQPMIAQIVETICNDSERYLGHLRQRLLVFLRSAGEAVGALSKQIDGWTTQVMTYGGDYEDQIDLHLAELDPIKPGTLEILKEEVEALLGQLHNVQELRPALAEFPRGALEVVFELSRSGELADFANHDPSRYAEERLSWDPPASQDMERWMAEVSEEEGEVRQRIHGRALPAIQELDEALRKLTQGLRDLYVAVKHTPAESIDNTANLSW